MGVGGSGPLDTVRDCVVFKRQPAWKKPALTKNSLGGGVIVST